MAGRMGEKGVADWFTIEKIDPLTFCISEYGHWEQTHAYLVIGGARAALIDTGLGVADIRRAVRRVTGLPVLVVTTHAHWDHIGGHRLFEQFAVHTLDAPWLTDGFPLSPEAVRHNLLREPCRFPAGFHPETYTVFQGKPSVLLEDGDCIDLGGRRLRAVHTPGHSPGHTCFFEDGTGYLFSGDLIYRGTLDAFYPGTDPQAFWRSVQKIQSLPVSKVLPGHFSLDVPVPIINETADALAGLTKSGRLERGAGMFSFAHFSVHL